MKTIINSIFKRLGLSNRDAKDLERIIEGQNVAILNLTKQVDDIKKELKKYVDLFNAMQGNKDKI